jgi:hypothetical protein
MKRVHSALINIVKIMNISIKAMRLAASGSVWNSTGKVRIWFAVVVFHLQKEQSVKPFCL